MSQVMVGKVAQFPDNISINEPVPGKTCLERGVSLKKTDTISDHCNGNKPAHNTVKQVDQKDHFVHPGLGLFIYEPQDQFKDQKERDDGVNE